MADERRKVWAAIVYPESLPKDWKSRLEHTHVASAVSPLHKADVWTTEDEEKDPTHKAGTRKKEHHHIVLYFEPEITATGCIYPRTVRRFIR